jgi:ribonuclease-3
LTIGAAITLLLDQLYPGFEAGAATVSGRARFQYRAAVDHGQMCKAQLVRDAFLAQISRRYGFPQRLIASPSERYNLIHGEKAVANLFEAYVAGLYYSYQRPDSILSPPPTPRQSPAGDVSDVEDASQPHVRSRGQARDLVDEWLSELFTPLAHWAVSLMRQEQERIEVERATAGGDDILDEQAAGATARLNEHFVAKEGRIPQYESLGVDAMGLWTMRCTAVKRDGTAL